MSPAGVLRSRPSKIHVLTVEMLPGSAGSALGVDLTGRHARCKKWTFSRDQTRAMATESPHPRARASTEDRGPSDSVVFMLMMTELRRLLDGEVGGLRA
jgi:hypothetical protein